MPDIWKIIALAAVAVAWVITEACGGGGDCSK